MSAVRSPLRLASKTASGAADYSRYFRSRRAAPVKAAAFISRIGRHQTANTDA
jgi:hypothetical protein